MKIFCQLITNHDSNTIKVGFSEYHTMITHVNKGNSSYNSGQFVVHFMARRRKGTRMLALLAVRNELN